MNFEDAVSSKYHQWKTGIYYIYISEHDILATRIFACKNLWRASRRCHDLSTGNTHFWKWSEWVPKCFTNIVCCQDMWELYYEWKKSKETVQTVIFTMCGRELPAEMTYFWWKLEKRKRIFLYDFHQYDLNGVYHEKADVLRIPKML